MASVYSRSPLKSTGLGTILLFGLENLPIGFLQKRIAFWIKNASLWSVQNKKRVLIMIAFPTGDGYHSVATEQHPADCGRVQRDESAGLKYTPQQERWSFPDQNNKKEGMKLQKEQFDITGMTCSTCSARIEKSVGKLPGIKEVSVNLLKNSMAASYDESVLDVAGIVQAVEKAGYGAFPKTSATAQNKSRVTVRTKNP